MSIIAAPIRIAVAILLLILAPRAGHSQAAAPAAKAQHPVVCARGVRVYTEKGQVPTPHDTLAIPAADGPIRVTSPEEADAAELALRDRAGSVGATGVLIVDEVSGDGDTQRVRRSATGVFVPGDSARAQQACK